MAGIPARQFNRVPKCRELAEHAGKVELPGALARRSVHGDGGVRLAFENRTRQAGEHRAGADLDKGVHAGLVEIGGLLEKRHRLCELTGQQGAAGPGG